MSTEMMTGRREKRGPMFRRSITLVGLAIGLAGASPASADVLAAGAATRGFYDWEVMGGYEVALPIRNVPPSYHLDFPARVEGHFAYRDNVANVALSTYLLLRFVIPGFEGGAFSPWLATGPGAHVVGSWSSLGDFGDVLTDSRGALKWHAFVGARLIHGSKVDLYTEARYTLPSEYDFDYIAFGLRFHGAEDDTTETSR